MLGAVQLPEDLGKHTVRGAVRGGLAGRREGASAISRRTASTPSRRPTPTRRSSWRSTTAAGRASPSTCVRASASAAASPRSRSSSSAPRTPPSTHTATEELGQNALVIRVQPDEGVTVRFGSKVPGTSMEIRDVTMDFAYGESFTESSPEAYERLHPRRPARRREPLPAPPRRSSCPGRSSTRSRSTGTSTASPRSTRPAPGVPSRRTRCSHETDGAGVGHEDRPHGHHGQQDQQGAGAGPPRHRHPGRRHGAHPRHRHRRGERLRRAEGRQRGVPRAPLAHPGRHQARLRRSPRDRAKARLDAEVRVGADAGTGETVVLRLYGDWSRPRPVGGAAAAAAGRPGGRLVAGGRARAIPAKDPLGALAQRRVTDTLRRRAAASHELAARAETYAPGDTDLSWTRITPVALDARRRPGPGRCEVTSADVEGEEFNPSCRAAGACGWRTG